jgi:hypothetical protein
MFVIRKSSHLSNPESLLIQYIWKFDFRMQREVNVLQLRWVGVWKGIEKDRQMDGVLQNGWQIIESTK